MSTGVYKRTKPAWNKGLKMSPRSEAFKKRLSQIAKERGLGNFWKGKKRSVETKEKIRQKQLKRFKDNPELRKIIAKNTREMFRKNPELKKRMSERFTGKNHPCWRGGTKKYTQGWTETLRKSIRERDNYTCQICGVVDEEFVPHVHHIDYGADNHNPDNLITICIRCHTKTNYNRELWLIYFELYKELIK